MLHRSWRCQNEWNVLHDFVQHVGDILSQVNEVEAPYGEAIGYRVPPSSCSSECEALHSVQAIFDGMTDRWHQKSEGLSLTTRFATAPMLTSETLLACCRHPVAKGQSKTHRQSLWLPSARCVFLCLTSKTRVSGHSSTQRDPPSASALLTHAFSVSLPLSFTQGERASPASCSDAVGFPSGNKAVRIALGRCSQSLRDGTDGSREARCAQARIDR